MSTFILLAGFHAGAAVFFHESGLFFDPRGLTFDGERTGEFGTESPMNEGTAELAEQVTVLEPELEFVLDLDEFLLSKLVVPFQKVLG